MNRARAIGLNLYCNRKCAGMGRRGPEKSKAQRVEEKRLYDQQYRLRDPAALKARKAEYHQRTYDPVKAAKERKRGMAQHVEYCRQPAYKAWKSAYDTKYRAKRDFGPFWEAAMLLLQIEDEVTSRMSRYEVYMANGTLNKALRRKREYEGSVGYCP